MKAKFIKTYDELLSLSPAWDALVEKSEHTSFFSASGFTRAWWRAYENSRSMHIAVVEDDTGMLRLIAPFQAEKTNPYRWELVGTNLITYNPFIMRKDDHEALRTLLWWLGNQSGWNKLVLRTTGEATLPRFLHSPSPSKVQKLIRWLRLRSVFVEQTVRKDHPYISHSNLNMMTDLLKKRNHRYSMNVLKREGVPGYRTTMDTTEIKSHFDRLCDLHIAEWHSRGRKSQFTDPETRNFYSFLFDEMAGYQTLCLGMLTVNDKAVAIGIDSKWNNRLESWVTCFDQAFASAAPGRLLLNHLIQDSISKGVSEVDLGRGLQRHKLEYTSDLRETVIVVIHRSPIHALATKLKARTMTQRGSQHFKN